MSFLVCSQTFIILCHYPLKLDFTKDVYVANYNEHEETKLWNAEMSDIFIDNFNTEDIMDLSDRLEGLKSKSNISQGDLNSLVATWCINSEKIIFLIISKRLLFVIKRLVIT